MKLRNLQSTSRDEEIYRKGKFKENKKGVFDIVICKGNSIRENNVNLVRDVQRFGKKKGLTTKKVITSKLKIELNEIEKLMMALEHAKGLSPHH